MSWPKSEGRGTETAGPEKRGKIPPKPGCLNMTAEAEKEVAHEVQLLDLGYYSKCKIRGCTASASVLARGVDEQGRPLKQIELCKAHAEGLKLKRNARDLRRRNK